MAVRHAILASAFLVAASAASAQNAPAPALPDKPAGEFKPDEAQIPPAGSGTPDTWIFSGVLQDTKESFSGTLVANKDATAQFEMKLGSGATCDGGQLKGEVGLVRLPEITCTDDRPMRALFVPQGGKALKVFGHVGEQRFFAEAHLLGTEAPPEAKQTAQPKGPLGLPPRPPGDAPAGNNPPAPSPPPKP